MTFTTNFFLIGLLPWFLLLIYLSRNSKKLRQFLIFTANIVFYAGGGYRGLVVVCFICIITWLFCKVCFSHKNKLIFVIGILTILFPLLSIKYTGFLFENVNAFFNTGLHIQQLVVPIGLSFYTFEAVSCLSDVYLGKVNTKITLIDTFLYLAFFPTVTSGPIIRISDFKEGYDTILTSTDFNTGIERIVIGLCKKILIADKIAVLADYYFNGVAIGNTYSVLGLWIGSITYTLQLYFDFSGYSDMAIGIGKLIGFKIPENFKEPYRSGSIQEFWRRWHISLSTWFRDYVYIPLGGNRCSVLRHIFNLLIVWILTGIWHGADWSFLIWGLGYFLLLIAEKYIPCMINIGKHWYGHIYALFFINLLWVPFRAADLSVTIRYLKGMFGLQTAGFLPEEKALRFLPFLCFVIILCLPWERRLDRYANTKVFKAFKGVILPILTVFAICAVLNSTYAPYIYGDF